MNSDVIIFVCANDVVLSQLGEFLRTLRPTGKGGFKGKVVVLTDEINAKYQADLISWGCEIFISNLEWPKQFKKTIDKTVAFEYAKKRQRERRFIDRVYSRLRNGIFRRISAFNTLHRHVVYDIASITYLLRIVLGLKSSEWESFHRLWCRKHLSKLLMLNYLEENDVSDSSILIMADSDMILQSSISSILGKVESDQCVYVGLEEKDTLSAKVNTSSVYWSNILAYEKDFYKHLSFGENAHEINVGFSIGYSGAMRKVFEGWRSMMIDPQYADLWFCHPSHFWHEQDFFRAYLNMKPDMVRNIGADSVYHGCGRAAQTLAFNSESQNYYDAETGSVPAIVHFAGSDAKEMPSIKSYYSMRHVDYMDKYSKAIAEEVSL